MINLFLEKLLEFYNLDYDTLIEESEKTLNDLPQKEIFKDGSKIASYIREAILSNKKILIYGDYDCDGIMSTSILMLALSTEEYKPGYYIPSREFDGYGLTKGNVDRFYKLGYQVIICVDNGITLNETIDYASSLGIEVIVLDHHKLGPIIPNAKYIMHPEYDHFGKYNISAGVVSFYFSLFYLNRFDDYLFSLCALSTLSDSMPLLSYNRLIVKEALNLINKNHYEEIFTLLSDQNKEINEDDLNMQVIPKINAICRLLNDNSRFNIVKYFISKDRETILKLSSWINSINERRKELVNSVNLNEENNNSNALIYINKENEGIGGLIANKLLNRYNKVTFVLSQSESDKNIYKGSARSKKGFDIAKFMASNADLFLAYGGHENAGGFSILKDKYLDLKNVLEKETKDISFKEDKNYIEIALNELNLKNYDIYRQFAPFGEGHIKPRFKISRLNINDLKNFIYNKHILYRVNEEASILIFNFDKEILEASFIDVFGYISLNTFRNIKSVQLIVDEYELIY